MISVSSVMPAKNSILIGKISNYFYSCKLCLFTSQLQYMMVTHFESPSSKELFDCTQKLSEPYRCQFCGFKSNLLARFRQHSLHLRRKPYSKMHNCKKCDFETHSWLILTRHTNLECQKNRQWFQCDQCTYASIQKGALKAHTLAKHTPDEAIRWFYCDQCLHRTKQKGDLRKHIQRIHIKETVDDKRFQCDKCHFRTKRRPCLKKHLLVMHNGENKGAREGGHFRCDRCSYRSNRIDNFKKHILEKHTPPEEIEWFECGQCSYKAKRGNRLKEHMLLRHTALEKIKWFECEQCSYKGKLKTNLRSHILTKHL